MAQYTSHIPKLITWAPVGKMHGSSTPFGIKIELALGMAGINYTVEAGNPLNPKSMPKQKVLHLPDSSAGTDRTFLLSMH